MMGSVAKIYLMPHVRHIRNEVKAEFSHCGRRISGVAWYVAEYYKTSAEERNSHRPTCKICLHMWNKLPNGRKQQYNDWTMKN